MNRVRLSVFAVILAGGTASAQFENPWSNGYGHRFNNPGSAYLDALHWNQVNQEILLRSILLKRGVPREKLDRMKTAEVLAAFGGAQAATEAAKKPSSTPPSTGFKPSGQRLMLADLAAQLTADPAQQKALQTVFAAGIDGYNAENGKDGLANDVAGGLTFLLGVAVMVTQDGRVPDDGGLLLLARQLQQALDTPEMKKTSDAQKQKMFELLVGLGSFMLATWQQAAEQGDAAGKAAVKALGVSFLQTFLKLDAAKVRVTATGLELSR